MPTYIVDESKTDFVKSLKNELGKRTDKMNSTSKSL